MSTPAVHRVAAEVANRSGPPSSRRRVPVMTVASAAVSSSAATSTGCALTSMKVVWPSATAVSTAARKETGSRWLRYQ